MKQTKPQAEKKMKLRLVPVEVFGTENCCLHGENVDCDSTGYGLCDAVSPWSDCNRAGGKIYRVDDVELEYRNPGEIIEIWIEPKNAEFFNKKWGSND